MGTVSFWTLSFGDEFANRKVFISLFMYASLN